MARYSDTVRDQNQLPVIGALVAVVNQDGTTPVLTDDDDNVLINPLTTDGYGTFYFNTAAGFYDLTFYYGGRKVTEEFGVQVPAGDVPAGLVPLVYDLGPKPSSTPLTDLSEEWNNAAVDFVGERRRFTGTAYAVDSVLISYEFDADRVLSIKPDGQLRVGSYADTSTSADPGVLLSRNIFNTGSGNSHGFVDNTQFRRSGAAAYATFDAAVVMTAEDYDHIADFQSRSAFLGSSGADIINDMYGMFCQPLANTGVVTRRKGVHIDPITLAAGATCGTQYGVFIASLTNASTNWAIYTDAATPSLFGGNVAVGGVAAASTDQVLTIGNGAGTSFDPGVFLKRNINDATASNAHGFVDGSTVRRSTGTAAYAAFDANTIVQAYSYNHVVSFQDRPNYQAASGAFTMTNLYGMFSQPAVDAGVVTTRDGVIVNDVTLTGGATMGTQYGIHVKSLANATTNWAVYTEGTTASRFGGVVTAPAFASTGNTSGAPTTALTGTTAETTYASATFPIPAGAMGASGQVEVDFFVSMSGSAGTKTVRVYLDGVIAATFIVAAATVNQRSSANISNKTASTQVCSGTGTISGYGASTSAVVTMAVNTALAKSITISGQLVNAADTMTLESFRIKTTYGA